jgi:nicotinate-nucleotide adenylyltransferase
MMKRVGILSGTFDPVHRGHIDLALKALIDLKLEKVWLLPEPRPRRKQGVKALEHRASMVRLAIEGQPQLGLIVLEQARFTPRETLPIIQRRLPGYELVMIMGDDMLSHLADWPHVEELVNKVSFGIALREMSSKEAKEFIVNLQKARGLRLVCSTFASLQKGISSSQVRLRLRKGMPSTSLDPKVADYIERHQLYSAEMSSSEK